MRRVLSVLVLSCCAPLAFAHADGPSEDDLKKKPVTTDGGPIGKLLKKWHAAGTAAGNVGDWYDNRDGEHSPLNLAPWPQLQKVKYTPEDIRARRHWAWQRRVLPHVVFGNSSTSAPPHLSGSNPRSFYCVPGGLALLEQQYRKNNLYIYPEHRDHDPGHNGEGDGYGDLFPTNTPYLLISQGSSGSDQPFMRAIPFTLAAFRPDVKKLLVEKGLLMPTVQRVFRACNKSVKKPEDYFTAAAHPSVFEGKDVDALAMVKMAHGITKETIPPLVQLKVVKEDEAVNGRDYVDYPLRTEKLADTPTVIARVWRGHAKTRTMVVSAKDSLDANGKKLTFRWVLLRGDPKRVSIKPRGDDRSEAEIAVEYHERRPIAPGSKLESNRVDIGVFAENGKAASAPAFVTWFTLDREARSYDGPTQIAYGYGLTKLTISDWAKALALLSERGPAAQALRVKADERKALAAVAKKADETQKSLAQTRKTQLAREKARSDAAKELAKAKKELADAMKAKGEQAIEKAKAAVAEAQKKHAAADLEFKAVSMRHGELRKQLDKVLDEKAEGLGAGARPFVNARLAQALAERGLHGRLLDGVKGRPANARVTAARQKLVALLGAREEKGRLAFPEKAKAFEPGFLSEYNATLLSEWALPGVAHPSFTPNFVDARLGAPRRWFETRNADGSSWRWLDGKVSDFTPEGWLVTKKDEKGRPVEARTVTYNQAPPTRGMWINNNPLTWAEGPERITFAYEGEKRVIKSKEKVGGAGP